MEHQRLGPKSADAFLQHSADMMSVQELDGRVVYVSPACTALLGYDQAVAGRLSRAVRPGDVVTRWGGDEFVVILRSVVTATELEEAASGLCEAVSLPVRLGELELTVGVNMGTSLGLPGTRVDVDEVIDRADQDMYRRRTEAQCATGPGSLAVA